MDKRTIAIDGAPRRIWPREILAAHVRATIRTKAHTDLEVFAGGTDVGPLSVRSSVHESGSWLSQVVTMREASAIAVASAFSEILGAEGWTIQGVPGLFVIEKPLLEPVRRQLGGFV